MFRTLRRQDRALSQEETMEILRRGKFGVLSIVGEDGYPYGVPLHYVVIDHAIYFHCSRVQGHKDDALAKNSKISFTVIETEDAIQCKSAILFGTAEQVPGMEEIVLEHLVEKFVPDSQWHQAKAGIASAKKKCKGLPFQYPTHYGKTNRQTKAALKNAQRKFRWAFHSEISRKNQEI